MKFYPTKYPESRIWGIETNSDCPDRIVYVYEAIKKLELKEDFSIVDIAAGHGTIVNGLMRLFPKCTATIVDIVEYPQWVDISSKRVRKLVIPLQEFIKDWAKEKYDIVMMLNSFRLWDNGKMRTRAREEFLEWLPKHADYFITSGGKLEYQQLEINGLDYACIPLQLYKLS